MCPSPSVTPASDPVRCPTQLGRWPPHRRSVGRTLPSRPATAGPTRLALVPGMTSGHDNPDLERRRPPPAGRCRPRVVGPLPARPLRAPWATPFDVAALAALWLGQEVRGHAPALELPADPAVRAYLVDMGLDRVIPGPWGPGGGCVVDPPWLMLTRLAAGDEWDDLQRNLWPAARQALGKYELAQRTLDILGELVDNAATHGESAVGTLVCAQRYTGATSGLPAGVWLGVADAGVGIPAHLRRNPKYADETSDLKLIALARRRWVTGTADRRGWGLVDVFENAAAAGPSRVIIRSGRGEGDFRLRPGRRVRPRYSALARALPGTWVHVQVEGG